jgi:hypothetical protein
MLIHPRIRLSIADHRMKYKNGYTDSQSTDEEYCLQHLSLVDALHKDLTGGSAQPVTTGHTVHKTRNKMCFMYAIAHSN